MDNSLINFIIKQFKKFIDVLLDSTLLLTLWRHSHVKPGEKYSQLLKKSVCLCVCKTVEYF